MLQALLNVFKVASNEKGRTTCYPVIRVTITQIDLNLEYCLILKWLKKDGDAASKFEIDAHI